MNIVDDPARRSLPAERLDLRIMAKEARHHHYIPQLYLRGFATGSGKRCKVQVAHLLRKHFFATSPRNVAGIRDFNRIAVEGFAPDAIEKSLADFEGKAATAIKNVVATRKFEGEDRIFILNLMALLAVRSPQRREHWRQFHEQISKQIMSLSLATKERWESQISQMKDDGVKVTESVSYEDMKAFHEKGEYKANVNTEHHLFLESAGIDAVLDCLSARRWMLYTTSETNGHFVTTDRPVVLTWKHLEQMPPIMRHSPGFGMRNTEVIFPLTHNMTLLGSFEGDEGTAEANKLFVAATNLQMIQNAFEYVYARKRAVPYLVPDAYHYDDQFMERFELLDRERKQERPKAE